MDATRMLVYRGILRAAIVAGAGMIVGLIFYGVSVFVPTMKASQFLTSSITVGIAYAAVKGKNLRNGGAALFVWYVLLNSAMRILHYWLLLLSFAYIAGMAFAVWVRVFAVKSRYTRSPVVRIALTGAILSLANGVIVYFLAIFSQRSLLDHYWMEGAYYNFQLGALIGLATGIGMELAEYVIPRFASLRRETAA